MDKTIGEKFRDLYIRHPDLFIKEYLGVELKLWQRMLLKYWVKNGATNEQRK